MPDIEQAGGRMGSVHQDDRVGVETTQPNIWIHENNLARGSGPVNTAQLF